MTSKRKIAVSEKRAMIRVRFIKNRRPATVGVCPACWNIPERRQVLLIKLGKKMDLEVMHKDDRYEGSYFSDRRHAPGCPYAELSADPWKRFESTLKSRAGRRLRSARGRGRSRK